MCIDWFCEIVCIVKELFVYHKNYQTMASADVNFDSCFEVVSKLVEEAGKVSFRLKNEQWKQILEKDLR